MSSRITTLLFWYVIPLSENQTSPAPGKEEILYLYTAFVETSLVPRPSHCPVFAVCKNRGGRPGPFYHMNVSSKVDREGEGSPVERMHFVHTFFVLNQEWYIFYFVNV